MVLHFYPFASFRVSRAIFFVFRSFHAWVPKHYGGLAKLAPNLLFLFQGKEVFHMENMEIKDHMPHAYARRLAARVARYLKKRYGATKVLLCGSVAIGAYNPDFSDIDVYFEGVREELVASALADCRRNFGEKDTSGRKRIDYICAAQLQADAQTKLTKSAEEI